MDSRTLEHMTNCRATQISSLRTSRLLILCGLLLLAFVPRCLMAIKVDVVCNDAVLYIDLAKHFSTGETNAATREFKVNTFPLILHGLNSLGFSYEAAGQFWNVLAATLVVLPLFGWLRRMFDERVAATACALYAVHPGFIEWSAEIIRGPTFWLLMTLSLYFAWRAAEEARFRHYLFAGTAISLAAATRIEGLLLLLPLAAWTVQRCREPVHRRRLVAGGLLCMAVPLVAFAVSAAFLSSSREADGVVRTVPIEVAFQWFASSAADAPALEQVSTASISVRLWQLCQTLVQGFNPVIGLLMLIGLVRWHRLARQRQFMPLWAVSLSLLCGMWVLLWYTGTSSTRYVVPMAILSTPWSALGLLVVVRGVRDAIQTHTRHAHCRAPHVGYALLVFVAMYGVADALTSNLDTRRNQAAAGRWIREQVGTGAKILGPQHLARRIAYYADAEYRTIDQKTLPEKIDRNLNCWRADAILMPTDEVANKPWSLLAQTGAIRNVTPDLRIAKRGVYAAVYLAKRDVHSQTHSKQLRVARTTLRRTRSSPMSPATRQ